MPRGRLHLKFFFFFQQMRIGHLLDFKKKKFKQMSSKRLDISRGFKILF